MSAAAHYTTVFLDFKFIFAEHMVAAVLMPDHVLFHKIQTLLGQLFEALLYFCVGYFHLMTKVIRR